MQQSHTSQPAMQPVVQQPYPQQNPYPAPVSSPAAKRAGILDKTQSSTFSTIVKALCILILLAGFLPFGTISCAPMTSISVTGYDLAFGAAAEEAAELSQGNMGMGMGMGAGQLAALNLLAGVNLLLVFAFVGTAVLLLLSLFMGRTRTELALALAIPAFSLAAYLQWLGIFSAFTDMFARASEMSAETMSAGPDIGLYAVIAFSALLVIVAGLEVMGKLPGFLTKGEIEGDIEQFGGVSPVMVPAAVPVSTSAPAPQSAPIQAAPPSAYRQSGDSIN